MPLLLCEIPWRHLGTNFSLLQFLIQYQTNSSPVHVQFISRHCDCQSSIGSSKFAYRYCVVTYLCCSPLHCSSSARVLSSENFFCQWQVFAHDIASFPKACWTFPCVVVEFSSSLTQQRWHTTALCSVLPFAGQGSQTRTGKSITYSTLRYCKTMALQVGMEEGPRSKPVCASRLQYCKYS